MKFEIIEKIQEKTKMNKEANVLTMVLIGKVKLHKYNKLKETKNIIRPVHSQFYILCRIQGKHTEFYATSLKYLGCTVQEDLSSEQGGAGQARLLPRPGRHPQEQRVQFWQTGLGHILGLAFILLARL